MFRDIWNISCRLERRWSSEKQTLFGVSCAAWYIRTLRKWESGKSLHFKYGTRNLTALRCLMKRCLF